MKNSKVLSQKSKIAEQNRDTEKDSYCLNMSGPKGGNYGMRNPNTTGSNGSGSLIKNPNTSQLK